MSLLFSVIFRAHKKIVEHALYSKILGPGIIYYLQEVHRLVIWPSQGTWWDTENNYKTCINNSINEAKVFSFSMPLSTRLSDIFLHLLRSLQVACDYFFYSSISNIIMTNFHTQGLKVPWKSSSPTMFIHARLQHHIPPFVTWDSPVKLLPLKISDHTW